jgi:small multidrug resistance pump
MDSNKSFPHGNVHGIYVTFNSYRKEVVMCWAWLFLAIALEVAATVFMKLSDGFSRIIPSAIMGVLYALSFVPLAIALKKMEVGTAYAVWSAVGTAMVTVVGVFLFKETVSAMKIISIAMIIVGVVFLSMSSGPDNRTQDTTASVESDSTPTVLNSNSQR